MYRSATPGFSLLELLITLSIVAILASITVPSYRGYVARARRTDAISALLQLQLAQLRWRATHPAYARRPAELDGGATPSPDDYYGLRILRSSAGDFLALASPRGAQQGDACGIFAISAQGPVTLAPYAGADCWRR